MVRRSTGMLLLGTLGLGVGCDSTMLTVQSDASATVDRSTATTRFTIVATTTADALEDIQNPDSRWFGDDGARSSLTVDVSTESRGFLGLGIVDTVVNAELFRGSGEWVDSTFWVVDKDKTTGTVFLDAVFEACSTPVCDEVFFLELTFADENARVHIKADAELLVDYDAQLASTPIINVRITAE